MWLVGMMGAGKTAVGRLAAEWLGVGFTDTDEVIAERAGRPIHELWEAEGEDRFRDRERRLVGDLAGFEGIVATGGGVVLDAANRAVMGGGNVVWLRARPAVLAERIGQSPAARPLLGGASSAAADLSRILDERASLYRMVADHEIDTEGLDIDGIAGKLEALWSG